MSLRLQTCLVLLIVTLVVVPPGLCKKKAVSPEDFPIRAKVIEVSSQQRTHSVTTTHPVLPDFCRDPKTAYQKSYCQTAAAGGDTSIVSEETVFYLTTEIGDKIYDLRGPRLELGAYIVRFAEGRHHRAGVEFLLQDGKGRPNVVWYQIVGERQKR